MHPFKRRPQMTSAKFNAALREAGFDVDQDGIVDVFVGDGPRPERRCPASHNR
jgi:hypothetical protein